MSKSEGTTPEGHLIVALWSDGSPRGIRTLSRCWLSMRAKPARTLLPDTKRKPPTRLPISGAPTRIRRRGPEPR